MRTFVIGDIHGANRALEQVLERSGFNKDLDLLISLGDVSDGWGETPECVDTLLSIKNRVDIIGNHDNWTHQWLTTGVVAPMWLSQGGSATRDAYIRTGDLVNPKHAEFFIKQVNFYLDEEKRLFVHGGWDWNRNPDFYISGLKPAMDGSTRGLNCHWDRSLFEGFTTNYSKTPKRLEEAIKPFKEIYIGHTFAGNPSFEPFNKGKLWNLDTGGGWDGKVTIMNVDTKEYWQSDLCQELYPEEKGRFSR